MSAKNEESCGALNYREAADRLGVSERSVWKLVHERDLPAFRIGRAVRIPRASLEEFIESRLHRGRDVASEVTDA